MLLVATSLSYFLGIQWVGSTDLDVEFVVSDADTGGPVAGASVEIDQEAGGFCHDWDAKHFRLVTGPDGVVSRRCLSCMCFGTKSMWKDSFVVHLPDWTFAVSAEGYVPTGPIELDEPSYQRHVERRQVSAGLRVAVSVNVNDNANARRWNASALIGPR